MLSLITGLLVFSISLYTVSLSLTLTRGKAKGKMGRSEQRSRLHSATRSAELRASDSDSDSANKCGLRPTQTPPSALTPDPAIMSNDKAKLYKNTMLINVENEKSNPTSYQNDRNHWLVTLGLSSTQPKSPKRMLPT